MTALFAHHDEMLDVGQSHSGFFTLGIILIALAVLAALVFLMSRSDSPKKPPKE